MQATEYHSKRNETVKPKWARQQTQEQAPNSGGGGGGGGGDGTLIFSYKRVLGSFF